MNISTLNGTPTVIAQHDALMSLLSVDGRHLIGEGTLYQAELLDQNCALASKIIAADTANIPGFIDWLYAQTDASVVDPEVFPIMIQGYVGKFFQLFRLTPEQSFANLNMSPISWHSSAQDPMVIIAGEPVAVRFLSGDQSLEVTHLVELNAGLIQFSEPPVGRNYAVAVSAASTGQSLAGISNHHLGSFLAT